MKKPKTDDIDQRWFEENMGSAVSRFDAAHAPPIPELYELEQLVHGHKREVKRKLWKELTLFWLTAVLVFSSMLWLLDSSRVWFIVAQAVFAVLGIGFAGMAYGRRTGHKWRS